MKSFILLLILSISTSSAMALPHWADLEQCLPSQMETAKMGITKGIKAESMAASECASRAKTYVDETNCAYSCGGFAWAKKCQWTLSSVKKASAIDFSLTNRKRTKIRSHLWQPEHTLNINLIQLDDETILLPGDTHSDIHPLALTDSHEPAQKYSSNFSSEGQLFNGFMYLNNLIPVKSGYFFLPPESYRSHIYGREVFFASNIYEAPHKIYSTPKEIIDFNFNVSFAQSLIAIEQCNTKTRGEFSCKALLVGASGPLFEASYEKDIYDPSTIAVGPNESIWVYRKDRIQRFSKNGEDQVSYNVTLPPGAINSMPSREFAVPQGALSDQFQSFYYNGALVGFKDLFLLNSSGEVVETYPVRGDCEGSGWTTATELFVNFETTGKPGTITLDNRWKRCSGYYTSTIRFYEEGVFQKEVNLEGWSEAPVLHRKNRMELALTKKKKGPNDREAGAALLTLFDSRGQQYKSFDLLLPSNRIITSRLMSFGKDRNTDTSADVAVMFAVPENSIDYYYGDVFLESFRVERQCLDYKFRRKEH